MRRIALILAGFVALEHVGIMILEMFFWTHAVAVNAFGISAEFHADTVAMAANQGLYNGFLAAGLFWGLFTGRRAVVIFFLLCVIIAAVFGAATVTPKILITQGAPALLALMATLFAGTQKPKPATA